MHCGWPAAFVVRTTSSLWELYAASGSVKPGLPLAALRPLVGVPRSLSGCPPVGRRGHPTGPVPMGTVNLQRVRPLARGGDPRTASKNTLSIAPPPPGAGPRWWAPQGQLSLHRLFGLWLQLASATKTRPSQRTGGQRGSGPSHNPQAARKNSARAAFGRPRRGALATHLRLGGSECARPHCKLPRTYGPKTPRSAACTGRQTLRRRPGCSGSPG